MSLRFALFKLFYGKEVKTMLEKLTGKRTYLTTGLMALAYFASHMGWIPPDVFNWVQGLGLPAALAALRASKSGS